MSRFELIESIPVRNVLGECILWNDVDECIYWTDIHSSILYRYAPDTSALEKIALPERLCSFGFVAGDQRLICAFESGIAFFEPDSGRLQWLYRPELRFTGTRFNDGRVDRQGRFWAGTMIEGTACDAEGRPTQGSLYRVAGDGCRKILGGIEISNSLCWSRDGRTLFFADSPTRTIASFDFDPRSGEPTRRRVFAEVTGSGSPDGSIVDAEGYLWNAQWGGSKIVRYAPTGAIDCELELPVTQPTCLCFGGRNLDLMFVSTATENLAEAELALQPRAGDVLVYRTGQTGLPENRYLPDAN